MAKETITKQYESLFETIRFKIDGEWAASEISDLIAYVDDIYNIGLFLQYSVEGPSVESRSSWFRDRLLREINRYRLKDPTIFDILRMSSWDEPEEGKEKDDEGPSREERLGRLLSQKQDYQALDSRGATMLDMTASIRPYEALVVRRIRFSSPGFADLAGLGEVVKQLKEFLLGLIDYAVNTKKRALEREALQIKNSDERLKLASGYLDLADKAGFSDTEKRKIAEAVLSRSQFLVSLKRDEKFIDVELLEEPGTGE